MSDLPRNTARDHLHHVVRWGKIIASMLLAWHNLYFCQDLMQRLQEGIAEGRFGQVAAGFLSSYCRVT